MRNGILGLASGLSPGCSGSPPAAAGRPLRRLPLPAAPCVACPDQCCLPAVQHRVQYQPVVETAHPGLLPARLQDGHGTGVLHLPAAPCTRRATASTGTRSAGRSPSSTTAVPHTVCKPVYEQHCREHRYVTYRTCVQEYQVACPYTTCRPVYETRYKTVPYTVCRPVVQEYQVAVPYTRLPAGLRAARPAGAATRSRGRRAGVPGPGPVHRLPAGLRAARPRAPVHRPPPGGPVLQVAGPVHDLPAGVRAARHLPHVHGPPAGRAVATRSRSRTRSASRSTRQHCREERYVTHSTVTEYYQVAVPYTVCRTVTEQQTRTRAGDPDPQVVEYKTECADRVPGRDGRDRAVVKVCGGDCETVTRVRAPARS